MQSHEVDYEIFGNDMQVVEVKKKELVNETLRVDTGCLVAFSPGINYDIEMTKGWNGASDEI